MGTAISRYFFGDGEKKGAGEAGSDSALGQWLHHQLDVLWETLTSFRLMSFLDRPDGGDKRKSLRTKKRSLRPTRELMGWLASEEFTNCLGELEKAEVFTLQGLLKMDKEDVEKLGLPAEMVAELLGKLAELARKPDCLTYLCNRYEKVWVIHQGLCLDVVNPTWMRSETANVSLFMDEGSATVENNCRTFKKVVGSEDFAQVLGPLAKDMKKEHVEITIVENATRNSLVQKSMVTIQNLSDGETVLYVLKNGQVAAKRMRPEESMEFPSVAPLLGMKLGSCVVAFRSSGVPYAKPSRLGLKADKTVAPLGFHKPKSYQLLARLKRTFSSAHKKQPLPKDLLVQFRETTHFELPNVAREFEDAFICCDEENAVKHRDNLMENMEDLKLSVSHDVATANTFVLLLTNDVFKNKAARFQMHEAIQHQKPILVVNCNFANDESKSYLESVPLGFKRYATSFVKSPQFMPQNEKFWENFNASIIQHRTNIW